MSDAANTPTSRELMAHCRASLPGYKVPRKFEIVDALRRTVTGKVARRDEGGGLPPSGGSAAQR